MRSDPDETWARRSPRPARRRRRSTNATSAASTRSRSSENRRRTTVATTTTEHRQAEQVDQQPPQAVEHARHRPGQRGQRPLVPGLGHRHQAQQRQGHDRDDQQDDVGGPPGPRLVDPGGEQPGPSARHREPGVPGVPGVTVPCSSGPIAAESGTEIRRGRTSRSGVWQRLPRCDPATVRTGPRRARPDGAARLPGPARTGRRRRRLVRDVPVRARGLSPAATGQQRARAGS